MKVTILGSGTSSGVPRIGNDWGDCDPAEPKNRRTRVAVLVQHCDTTVVIDTGPDFREQMLTADVRRLDAVLLTHDHADHTHGIDDLRQFFHLKGQPVQCYAAPATWAGLQPRFAYVFSGTSLYPPTAVANPIPAEFIVGAMRITSFNQNHGSIDSLGFRFECDNKVFAYSTDVKSLPEASATALADLDLWVVDALRRRPHPTHSHLDQTLDWVQRFAPKRSVLTHMDHTMDYASLRRELPEGVEPGFDGLSIDL